MNGGIGTKWLAGTLLGFPLSLAVCTLAVLWLPGGWQSGIIGAITASLPLWVAIISASLLFATSRAAWLWLGAANLICFGALWGLRLIAVPGAAA
ncbi:hypothetical protein J5T34_09115 [Cupriavidus gilardii]|uniref:hypothetical protein n=1 Tax=Cupriavidus gilardii TaxID=82541 RepID=UPI001ABDF46E|nr:hypothetical protein [Cupriavidus gilardii]MBO4120896.1 hypothetical protein [Cupriavidus gilardii]